METKNSFISTLSIVILLLIQSLSVFALPITKEQAAAKALFFFSQRKLDVNPSDITLSLSASPIVNSQPAISSQGNSQQKVSQNTVPYYIFNNYKHGGFVIISGDNRFADILGYNDNQNISDRASMPDNMRYFLKSYEEEMAWVITNFTDDNDSLSDTAIIGTAAKHPSERINPLCQTFWGQSNPYNLYTPTVNGQHTPTGCVATAMAQVMFFHKWPQEEIEGLPGYFSRNNGNLDDLPAITFDWDNMTTSYSNGTNSIQQAAVARLMQYCGWLVEMNYAPGGSGAYTMFLPYLMREGFGYGHGAKYADRDDYSIEEWENLMFQELKSRRPIIYTGYTSAMEGHAFVCDGYDGNGLFHINWGWNGSYNGYYRLSVLNAGGTGIGGSSTSNSFTCGQSAIIGLSPEGVSDIGEKGYLPSISRPEITGSKKFSRTGINDNFKNISFETLLTYNTIDLDNEDMRGKDFPVAVGVFSGDRCLSILAETSERIGMYNNSTFAASFDFGAGLSDGVYQLKTISKKQETGDWEEAINADRRYVEARIEGNNLTLTVIPRCDFEVIKTINTGSHVFGFDLYNPGEEYNGDIYLYNIDGELLGYEHVGIPAESTDHVDIYVEDNSKLKGDAVLTLSVTNDYNDYFYISAINDGANLKKNITLTNMFEETIPTVYGNKIGLNLNIENTGEGAYNHLVEVTLETEDKTSSSLVLTERVEIPSQSSRSFNFAIPVKNGYLNKKYRLAVAHFAGKERVLDNSQVFTIARGANYWTADGTIKALPFEANLITPEDALAIELRQGKYTSVTPNSNPNTIYMLSQQLPEGLEGHNLINATGGASTLYFTDGYDYIIPEQITAQQGVVYQRIFGGVNAHAWQTISLPFLPTSITTDDGTYNLTVAKTASDDADIYLGLIQKLASDDEIKIALSTDFVDKTPCFILANERIHDKVITFTSGKNVVLSPNQNSTFTRSGISMIGTNGQMTPNGAYIFNENQTITLTSEPRRVDAFRSFFMINIETAPQTFSFDFPLPGLTDINEVVNAPEKSCRVYSINGQYIGTKMPKEKGIYILDGRKVVVK